MPRLTFIGHAAFTLEHEGVVVAVDPFITGNPTATISADDLHPNVILVTHAHNDHVGDTVALAKRTSAPVICLNELADWLESQGVEAIGGNLGGTVAFEGGTATFTLAWHTSSLVLEDGSVVASGVPAGFLVRLGEKKIYFAGDTALFLDMQLIGEEEPDVAVLPIGDHFTMGPKDAVRAACFVRPRYVVPCHYDTFPTIEQDVEAFKKEVEEKTSAACVPLKPGESFEID
jgi:L-ascorbate metabolism protein UlaG (beta-lactamase superfamily)